MFALGGEEVHSLCPRGRALPSTLVPLCNSVLFRISSAGAWLKKKSVNDK